MGMFDTVNFDYVMPCGINGKEYQTKDLDCVLDTYTIRKTGQLVNDSYPIHKQPKNIIGFNGSINIYTSFNKPLRYLPHIYEGKVELASEEQRTFNGRVITFKKSDPTTRMEYTLTFKNGFLKTIKSIYLDEVFEFS